MHLLWQMNQGKHYFRYLKAKENNDKKKARNEFFMATFLIFIMHGCWDAVISLISHFLDKSRSDLLGSILFVILIAFGITYIVISIKRLRESLKNNPKPKKA